MLRTINELAIQLNDQGIRYCHWKSNWALADSISGEADLDMLVHREDASRFRSVIEQLGFRPVVDASNAPFPAVEHFHALDVDSGEVAHVHSYYRIITGQSLMKNYRLPVEEMLLENTRLAEASLQVPDKAAELILFTMRMLVKHTSPFELALILRQRGKIKEELVWLLDGDTVWERARALLVQWLPQLDQETFDLAVGALQKPAPIWRRIVLGFRIRRRLRGFARHSSTVVQLDETRKFSTLLFHRLRGSKKGLTPAAGGAVIAFAGSEATGKSTLLDETASWLGEHYTLDRVHAGKPPSARLTRLLNSVVPLMRRVSPASRSTVVEAAVQGSNSPTTITPLFALRSVSLAYDRRALLLKAHAHAANGRIVLCDRYPSIPGQVDGPQLNSALDNANTGKWLSKLARLEARLYADIPPPELVICLTASLETTLARNSDRDKTEPEEYVRRRHARSSHMTFERAPTVRINTDGSLSQAIDQVKKAVWNAL